MILKKFILLLYFTFLGYGTNCCSKVLITLRDDILAKQSSRAGIYKKNETGLLNGRNHWTSLDGNQAIWYNSIHNRWAIGFSSDLGSNAAGIVSTQDSHCPTSLNRFKYSNGNGLSLAPSDSIQTECICKPNNCGLLIINKKK